jgi:hypothetical protein
MHITRVEKAAVLNIERAVDHITGLVCDGRKQWVEEPQCPSHILPERGKDARQPFMLSSMVVKVICSRLPAWANIRFSKAGRS